MKAHARIGGYSVAFLVLVISLVASPAAWATPSQSGLNQTIPTLTPRGSSPTDPPTSRPAADTATPRPLADTPVPQVDPATTSTPSEAVTTTPTVTPAPLALLTLSIQVDRSLAWVGTEPYYTLTLANQGTGAAESVLLVITFPPGLNPVKTEFESSAVWDGSAVRFPLDTLLPREERVVTFSAIVSDDVSPGAVLITSADAMVNGEAAASARVAVALPPAELPATGMQHQR
jgi:hypothetical protein